jgi:hypothetical protein
VEIEEMWIDLEGDEIKTAIGISGMGTHLRSAVFKNATRSLMHVFFLPHINIICREVDGYQSRDWTPVLILEITNTRRLSEMGSEDSTYKPWS